MDERRHDPGRRTISPLGDRAATIAKEGGEVWEMGSLPPRRVGIFPFAQPYSIDFSRDGGLLIVSGGHKPALTLIDAATAAPRKSWSPQFACESAAFAPDGRHLAVECHRAIWILRLSPPPAKE